MGIMGNYRKLRVGAHGGRGAINQLISLYLSYIFPANNDHLIHKGMVRCALIFRQKYLTKQDEGELDIC